MTDNICEKYDFINGGLTLRPQEPDDFGMIQKPETLRELSAEEAKTLAECESVVDEHSNSFLKAAEALLTIHAQKLYLKTHNTFHAYVQERFGFQRNYAYRQMNAARLLLAMSPSGNVATDVKEGTVRAVASLPADQKKAIIDEIKNQDGPVTQERVRKALVKHTGDRPKKQSKMGVNECGTGEQPIKSAVSIRHLKNLADKAVDLLDASAKDNPLAQILKELQTGLTCLSLQNN